jgi:leader peptidase (prepilin peptidase)/N-methyltransferase
MGAWWVLAWAGAGGAVGVAASGITRRFVSPHHNLARSWWSGALTTAAVLAFLAWRQPIRPEAFVYAFVAVLGVPLGLIDWTEQRLPRLIVWTQLFGAGAAFACLCVVRNDPSAGVRAVLAMAGAAALYLLLAVVVPDGVGAGDVRLAAVVGLVAGWSSWTAVVVSLLLASLLALVWSTATRLRKPRRSGLLAVPFGPFLLGGLFLTVTFT